MRGKSWLQCILVAGSLLTGGCLWSYIPSALAGPGPNNPPIVNTRNGMVQGLSVAGLNEFLGIPYAAPPVGALRWQPPQPAARYIGVLQATQFGSACPQVATPFGTPSLNENCLFLNVYTPSVSSPGKSGNARPGRPNPTDPRNGGKLPVMVFFHGGDFIVGAGSLYDPTSLVLNGNVIVVTVNYRLGVFGFLADPALSAEQPDHASGNYGLMDQQAALRWVQANIKRFGGNPRNVTVFGQSAGGASVISQLISPQAAGLFQRAIVESGSYNLMPQTLAQSEAFGTSFASSVGCTTNVAACLRNLTTAQLVAATVPSFGLTQLNTWGPNTGGAILPLSPAAAFSSGRFNRVPVINGTNGAEGSLFVALAYDLKGAPLTAAGYPGAVQSLVGPVAAPYTLKAYPLSAYPSPDQAFAAIFTDAGFACPAYITDTFLANYTSVYAYEFNDPNAQTLNLPPVSFPYGPTHTDELPYLFSAVGGITPALSPAQHSLSNYMVNAWTQFAAQGKTPGTRDQSWQPFSSAKDNIESLIPPTPQTETTFYANHKCALWIPLLGYTTQPRASPHN